MKRAVKYSLLLLVIALVGYKSVYFKKLSTMEAKPAAAFNAESFSKKLWEEQLPARLDSAVELVDLMNQFKTNPVDAFAKHSHAIGIGNNRYFLVKLLSQVEQINEDDMILWATLGDSSMKVLLATEYIWECYS